MTTAYRDLDAIGWPEIDTRELPTLRRRARRSS